MPSVTSRAKTTGGKDRKMPKIPQAQCSPYPGNATALLEILPPTAPVYERRLPTAQTRLGESLVSKRELARFLGISTSGLDKLIAKGATPPHVLVGRLLKWIPADVRAWAAQMQREQRLQHNDHR
jgi:predicted DNA-binding transcriptional regulator AlpA